MSHIVPLILNRIASRLTEQMQTIVPKDDRERANKVKVGRFQDNPLDPSVYLAVSGGNPEDPEYFDGIVSREEFANIAVNMPPREIGTGEYWWRRGVVEIGCYLKGDEEEYAREVAYSVLGGVSNHIERTNVTDLVDEFGERAIKLYLTGTTFFQGGGPPKNFIWRGKVFWSCLTERT